MSEHPYFVRAGLRLINMSQVVELDVFPELPERTVWDEEEGKTVTEPASPLEIRITTTAVAARPEWLGYDQKDPVGMSEAYVITLRGEEARQFFSAIRYIRPNDSSRPRGTQNLSTSPAYGDEQ